MRWRIWSTKCNWPYAADRNKVIGWVETDGLVIMKAAPKLVQYIGEPLVKVLGASLDFGI
jgi:hypothetical protein